MDIIDLFFYVLYFDSMSKWRLVTYGAVLFATYSVIWLTAMLVIRHKKTNKGIRMHGKTIYIAADILKHLDKQMIEDDTYASKIRELLRLPFYSKPAKKVVEDNISTMIVGEVRVYFKAPLAFVKKFMKQIDYQQVRNNKSFTVGYDPDLKKSTITRNY